MSSLFDPRIVDDLLRAHDAVTTARDNDHSQLELQPNPLLDEILNYPSITKQATGALAFTNISSRDEEAQAHFGLTG